MARQERTFSFDPTRLNELLEANNMTVNCLHENSGVSVPALVSWRSGKCAPNIESAVRVADCLGVPLDYLLGRCDKETAEKLLADYPACFMALRRAPWESYLNARKHQALKILPGCEEPYPYNLMHEIEGGEIDFVMSDEQCGWLKEALSKLTAREQYFLKDYYEDGRTLDQIAEKHHLTRERVRQIIAKGVRKLRHPRLRNLILCGPDYVRSKNPYNAWKQQLAGQLEELEAMQQAIEVRKADIALKKAEVEAAAAEINESANIVPSMTLEDLDLSVRSYNVLRRAGCRTLSDAVELARGGRLHHVRNMGRKSLGEVLEKIQLATGEDLRGIYTSQGVVPG